MNQHPRCRPVRPAVPRLARHAPALKDAARRQRRWPRQAARPSLTAAAYLAWRSSGRDEKTALQPNQETLSEVGEPLRNPPILMRQRRWCGYPEYLC